MHSVQRTSNLSNSATIYDEIIFQNFLITNMKEKLVSVIFQIIPDCWSSIKDTELLNISSTGIWSILRGWSGFMMANLVKYYLKKCYESY